MKRMRFLLSTAAFMFALSALPAKRANPSPQTKNPPVPPDYICLDTVAKAVAPDGGTVFAFIHSTQNECEIAVMPSPLSATGRDLLSKMGIAASNVYALYVADQLRESEGQEKTWGPLIAQGVRDFRRMRGQFCSDHPDMFLYQLQDDGEQTAPRPCLGE